MSVNNIPKQLLHEAGTEVIIIKDFKKKNNIDMACCVDEFLKIISYDKSTDLYKVTNPSGESGLVPSSIIVPTSHFALDDYSMPWLHGLISRTQTETLFGTYFPGLFLVRQSNNYKGDFTLCLCISDKVEHYRINCDNNNFTIDDIIHFGDLNALILHYSMGSDGLAHKLISYVDNISHERRDTNVQSVSDISPSLTDTVIISKLSDVVMGELIGKGEFAGVSVARYNNKTVAVKVLDKQEFNRPFNEEAFIMSHIKHENLVKLIAVKLSDDNSYVTHIVTEYVANGSLVDYLRSRGRAVITQRNLLDFACDTCSGMAYLEKVNIVHRDLAARNVLVTEDHRAKISDFGLAHDNNPKQEYKLPRKIGKVPIKWTSPEALREEKYTNKSDMWSFGVFLWELYMFGRVPYPHVPINEIAQHVEKGYRMEKPDECADDIYALMMTAWTFQANKRPDFCTVKVTLEAIRSFNKDICLM